MAPALPCVRFISSVKAQPMETWESRPKFVAPGCAGAAVHAGSCSLGGVHLHIKKSRVAPFYSNWAQPSPSGSMPAPSRSAPGATGVLPASCASRGRERGSSIHILLDSTWNSLFGSPAPLRVLQQLGLPPGGGGGGILPPLGGSSGGCHGKSPLSANGLTDVWGRANPPPLCDFLS